MVASCGEKKPETPPASAPTAAAPATAANADKFVADVNADLRRMRPPFSAAQWLAAPYITDDSQLISSRATEEFLG